RKVYLVAEGEGTKMRIVQENKDWVDFANETQAARRDNLLIAGCAQCRMPDRPACASTVTR
ncbi:MAG: hypothetical protein M3N45_15880, partial [Actinomycetota bacterium]|nr:hypothetical protein [Actinomycetota bacterium]